MEPATSALSGKSAGSRAFQRIPSSPSLSSHGVTKRLARDGPIRSGTRWDPIVGTSWTGIDTSAPPLRPRKWERWSATAPGWTLSGIPELPLINGRKASYVSGIRSWLMARPNSAGAEMRWWARSWRLRQNSAAAFFGASMGWRCGFYIRVGRRFEAIGYLHGHRRGTHWSANSALPGRKDFCATTEVGPLAVVNNKYCLRETFLGLRAPRFRTA